MEEEKYLKRQRIYKTIMLVILTAFLTTIITTVFISNKYNLTEQTGITSLINNSTKKQNLETALKNIQLLIDKYYLNDIDEQKAIDGAIAGYISALGDPYTEYIPADEMEEYTEAIMGNYVGIGIYMFNNTEKNVIEIQMPVVGSPAEEAGILPGDIILKIDDTEYTGEQITAAANNIKGKEGTTVKLQILRGAEILNFEIARKEVLLNPVIAKKMENNIGYIQISSFDRGTAQDFKNKYESLAKEGIKSLIIDLRNNGGGLVDETLQIADYIVPKGKELLVTVNKNKKETVKKAKEDVLIDLPIVVLVNKNSASASEILAGALKDLGEATIVGTKTYGKGVIQQLLTLKTGAGVKITVEEYYTPNRNRIQDIGIEPNEVVELPKTVTNTLNVIIEEDTQLKRALEILSQ